MKTSFGTKYISKSKIFLYIISMGLVLCTMPGLALAKDLPSVYDLRDEAQATCAKAQDPWGSCWAFGAVSSMESSLLKQGLVDIQDPYADLSEHHLTWFGSIALDEANAANQPSCLYNPEAHSQAGEGQVLREGFEDADIFDLGAWSYTAASTLATQSGIETEENFPYCNSEGDYEEMYEGNTCVMSLASSSGDWGLDRAYRFPSAPWRLLAFELLSAPYSISFDNNDQLQIDGYDPQANEKIKQTLMNTGAVAMSYAADTSEPGEEQNSDYFNYETWSQYRDEPVAADHTVSIIGWDDSYKKENFENNATRQGRSHLPEGDGAWIVKNSWGSIDGGKGNTYDWGVDGQGTFYLSYYDKSITDIQSFIMGKASWDTVMQYDFAGFSVSNFNNLVFDPDEQLAVVNIFQAPYDMEIGELSCFAQGENPEVEAEVYILGQDYIDPEDGYLIGKGQGSWELPGYHCFALDEPIEIAEGDCFSVIEKVTSLDEAGNRCPELPLEIGISDQWFQDDSDGAAESGDDDEVSDDATKVVARLNKGESWYSLDKGQWQDCADLNEDEELTEGGITYGNALIKAFGNKIDDGHHVQTFAEYDEQAASIFLIGAVCSGLLVLTVVVVVKRRKKK